MSATYIIEASYKGKPSKEIDAAIRKAADKTEDGSGYSFPQDRRDFTWTYEVKRYALAFCKRLKAAKIKGVTITLDEYKLEKV